jgi:hypothetical protein
MTIAFYEHPSGAGWAWCRRTARPGEEYYRCFRYSTRSMSILLPTFACLASAAKPLRIARRRWVRPFGSRGLVFGSPLAPYRSWAISAARTSVRAANRPHSSVEHS